METNESPRAHATLFAALAAAQRKVKAVGKAARNSHHGYNYASADAIIDEASEALSAEGLAVFPVSIGRDPEQPDHVWEKGSYVDEKTGATVADSWIVTPRRILAVYELVHESGEKREFRSSTPVIPEKGRPEDKAEFGARTENLGYALRDLLLIPREDMAQNTPSARDDSGYKPRPPAPKAPAPSAQPPQKQANGGPVASPKAETSSTATPPSTLSVSGAKTGATTEPVRETTVVPDLTPEQDREIADLFRQAKTRKLIGGAAINAFTHKVTGKTAGFNSDDGRKLAAALKEMLAAPAPVNA